MAMFHLMGQGVNTANIDTLALSLLMLIVRRQPVLDDGYHDKAAEMLGEHKPAGPFRGGKYSAFEEGTRVPTTGWVSQPRNPSLCRMQLSDNVVKIWLFDGLRLRLTHPTR